MNKYLYACFLACATPAAFANIGSGFYLTLGGGAGLVEKQNLESFDLNYPELYFDNPNPDDLDDAVKNAFESTAQYNENQDTVIAGRAALGYMWNIFDGEPTKFAGAIYTVNATLGLEVGYRIFDNVDDSHLEIEQDSINSPPNPCFAPPPGDGQVPCNVYEDANSKTKLQAVDVLAVARLPFTEDSKFALLLKGGVAYNIYELETTITVNADSSTVPPNYDNEYTIKDKHYEFLPVLGAGLEYMFYSHFGLSVEYNAIFASSYHANSQLISGNLVFRM